MAGTNDMLAPEDLELIRELFDNNTMCEAALAAVAGTYPRAAPYTRLMLDQLYREDDYTYPESVPKRERRIMTRGNVERVVLTALAMKQLDWALAVHIYWALCIKNDPLTVEEIGEIIMIAAYYNGAATQSEGTEVLQAVLQTLTDCATRARGAKTPAEAVAAGGVQGVMGELMGIKFPIVGK